MSNRFVVNTYIHYGTRIQTMASDITKKYVSVDAADNVAQSEVKFNSGELQVQTGQN